MPFLIMAVMETKASGRLLCQAGLHLILKRANIYLTFFGYSTAQLTCQSTQAHSAAAPAQPTAQAAIIPSPTFTKAPTTAALPTSATPPVSLLQWRPLQPSP